MKTVDIQMMASILEMEARLLPKAREGMSWKTLYLIKSAGTLQLFVHIIYIHVRVQEKEVCERFCSVRPTLPHRGFHF